jgi:hypothetical protein
MDRKSKSRIRLVNLRASGNEDRGNAEGPIQEVVNIGLGYRILISEQAEVWTVSGTLRDGTVARDDMGELSFVIIPGEGQPATAITGYLAPSAPYRLAIPETSLREQLRDLVGQLGYDREGYYLAVGTGGSTLYEETEPPRLL